MVVNPRTASYWRDAWTGGSQRPKVKPFQPNMPDEELAAVKRLKKEQQERNIIIKPNDKMGGQSVINTDDYVEKVEGMLTETFVDENGEDNKYYEGPMHCNGRDVG